MNQINGKAISCSHAKELQEIIFAHTNSCAANQGTTTSCAR